MSLWKNKRGSQSCAEGASQKAEGEISLHEHYDYPRTLPGQSSSYSGQILCAAWAQSIRVVFLPVPCGPSNYKAYVTVDSTVLYIFPHMWQFSIICDKFSVLFSQTLSNYFMGTFVHSSLAKLLLGTPSTSWLAGGGGEGQHKKFELLSYFQSSEIVVLVSIYYQCVNDPVSNGIR